VRRVYNSAWEANWGFVPMTDAEFDYMAKDLKRIVNPELCQIAEVEGKAVGFTLAVPNINQVLAKLNGRLFPFGLIKLLWHSRKIYQARIITMGVMKEYRRRGIDLLFYAKLFEDGRRLGYCEGEMSWILEDNELMIRALGDMGARHCKTYRIFDCALEK
jgi:GNAT superfamily N-acetyltransferase